MKKFAVIVVFMQVFLAAGVYASGDHGGSPGELHPATQIGLPDAKVGHGHGGEGAAAGHGDAHGGGADLSALFDVASDPANFEPAVPQTMRFIITEKEAGLQIKNFEITHDKELHLIIVSSDMEEFFHVHPQLQTDGTFLLENFTFSREITYTMFYDLKPAGTDGILLQKKVAIGKNSAAAPFLKATQFPTDAQNIRLDLKSSPSNILAGQEVTLNFRLADIATGALLEDIQTYLAAPAHLVMLSEATMEYLHVHPLTEMPTDPEQLKSVRFGPDIPFAVTFPNAGAYKGWLQLQRNDAVTTLPFVIEVAEGNDDHHGATAPGLTRDEVAKLVHETQLEEEARSVMKFAALTIFIFGLILLFYPRRPKPSPIAPETAQTSQIAQTNLKNTQQTTQNTQST